ncbi:hypothetical protein [Streptomyces sp. JS01]|uniref:hypothetical protein n=1 Tax=Streptomyces sp. JS01 TaxID=1525753 RepID=UPI00067B5C5C|nr:hypothetical protein [Streptomyces sp. JS01]
MSAADETAIQALSAAGAFCGECGFEPGDRGCPDCERVWAGYVKALRAAGWVPRTEGLIEAADVAYAEGDRLYDEQGFAAAEAAWGLSTVLRRMADPSKTGQDSAATPLTQSGPAQPDPTAEADRWNAANPVGSLVVAYPGCRPEGNPKAKRLTTRTRTKASVLGGHTAVVWVHGHGACIALTHVDRAQEGGAS